MTKILCMLGIHRYKEYERSCSCGNKGEYCRKNYIMFKHLKCKWCGKTIKRQIW